MQTVRILKFKPLTIEFTDLPEAYEGEVAIILPDHHYVIYDLSMDGLLPGGHLGADAPLWQLSFDVVEPLSPERLMALILELLATLESAHKAIQEQLNDAGSLL